jgi:hypothetical protein
MAFRDKALPYERNAHDRHIKTGLLSGAAVAAGVATVQAAAPAAASATADPAQRCGPVTDAVTVYPGDPRYQELTVGYNQRWVGTPDYVRLVSSTAQVVRAVQEAVDSGRRISVVSGGHCLAPFVFNSDVKVVIDLSGLNDVYFDPERRAFAVEGGARLSMVYETLYKKWGVTIPGGMCPTVGIGGHTTGGGYGFLSREFGAVIDHLEAVEMVVVDRSGRARAVVASRTARRARLAGQGAARAVRLGVGGHRRLPGARRPSRRLLRQQPRSRHHRSVQPLGRAVVPAVLQGELPFREPQRFSFPVPASPTGADGCPLVLPGLHRRFTSPQGGTSGRHLPKGVRPQPGPLLNPNSRANSNQTIAQRQSK